MEGIVVSGRGHRLETAVRKWMRKKRQMKRKRRPCTRRSGRLKRNRQYRILILTRIKAERTNRLVIVCMPPRFCQNAWKWNEKGLAQRPRAWTGIMAFKSMANVVTSDCKILEKVYQIPEYHSETCGVCSFDTLRLQSMRCAVACRCAVGPRASSVGILVVEAIAEVSLVCQNVERLLVRFVVSAAQFPSGARTSSLFLHSQSTPRPRAAACWGSLS